jgi:hypothetical protein
MQVFSAAWHQYGTRKQVPRRDAESWEESRGPRLPCFVDWVTDGRRR